MRSLRSARSALGPCRNGPTRPSAGTNGPRGTAGRRPSCSSSWDDASVRFRLWSRRSGSVRRAADGQQPATVGINMNLGEPSRIVG
jgi:hypothetical protein